MARSKRKLCSRKKKAGCRRPCKWTVGKGCRSSSPKKRKSRSGRRSRKVACTSRKKSSCRKYGLTGLPCKWSTDEKYPGCREVGRNYMGSSADQLGVYKTKDGQCYIAEEVRDEQTGKVLGTMWEKIGSRRDTWTKGVTDGCPEPYTKTLLDLDDSASDTRQKYRSGRGVRKPRKYQEKEEEQQREKKRRKLNPFADPFPLFTAFESGDWKAAVMDMINAKKVDLDTTRGDRKTVLFLAAVKGREGIAKALIEAGANLDVQEIYNGRTALHVAALNGREHIVKALIDGGANVNLQDKDVWGKNDNTALHVAAYEGYDEIVKALIGAKEVDLDVQNESGWTALHEAAHEGREGIAKALIDAGANVDIQNKDGKTALILATNIGHEGIVDALLEAEAHTEELSGLSPKQLAWLENRIRINRAQTLETLSHTFVKPKYRSGRGVRKPRKYQEKEEENRLLRAAIEASLRGDDSEEDDLKAALQASREEEDLKAALQASLRGDDSEEEDLKAALQASLKDDSTKMQVMKTKADGNCGFHAVLQIMADTYAVDPNHQDLNNNLATFMKENPDIMESAMENQLERYVHFSPEQMKRFKQFVLDARIRKEGQLIDPFKIDPKSGLETARSIIERGLETVTQEEWMNELVLFVVVLIFNLRINVQEQTQGDEIFSIQNNLDDVYAPPSRHTGYMWNNQTHFEYGYPDENYLEAIVQAYFN